MNDKGTDCDTLFYLYNLTVKNFKLCDLEITQNVCLEI